MELDKSPEKKARRAKNVNATAHRSGEFRAAVKPQGAGASSIEKLIFTYMGSVKTSLSQTSWGPGLAKYASTLRSSFGLAANDTPYLLCDVAGTRKAGMVLSTTGIHIADGRGGTASVSWKDLARTSISYARGSLNIGQVRIVTADAQTLAGLLQHLQKNA